LVTTDGDAPTGWPEMLMGPGSIRHLPGLIEDGRWRRALLVCGKRSFEASGASDVLPDLERIAEVCRFDDFVSNTDARDILRGLTMVREFHPEVVVGIGGGSTLDMAKLLCTFEDVEDDDDLFERIRVRNTQPRRPGLVLIPTTSGSGSEATHFAVVYVDDEKYSVAHRTLRPDAVVLDSVLSLSASRYQKATSGIDAVCQAIESLWAVGATPTSRRFARRALRYLLPSIISFTNDGDEAAAKAMSRGSHLAGRAIDISRTTGAHALSYAITKGFGVSHGHAVATTLGAFIELHASADPAALRPQVDPDEHRTAMDCVLNFLGADNGVRARMRFNEFLARLGLSHSLVEFGVETSRQRQELIGSLNVERMSNNPVVLNPDALDSILSGGRPCGSG
jgi:alcohol dehydrogenase